MERYSGKNFAEALKTAARETGKSIDAIRPYAHVISERKSLFSTQVVIGLFTQDDVFQLACSYLDKALDILGAKATYKMRYNPEESLITIDIESGAGSRIIGRNGENLKALNTLTRSAVFAVFGREFKILLDCDNYKEIKYQKVSHLALSAARDVVESHIPSPLPPMPSDERRQVHRVLSGMRDIDVSSTGEGKHRHIVIRYSPGNVARSDYDK